MDFKGYFTFEANGFLKNRDDNPPLTKELRKEVLKLLFKIGKHVLEYYGIYED